MHPHAHTCRSAQRCTHPRTRASWYTCPCAPPCTCAHTEICTGAHAQTCTCMYMHMQIRTPARTGTARTVAHARATCEGTRSRLRKPPSPPACPQPLGRLPPPAAAAPAASPGRRWGWFASPSRVWLRGGARPRIATVTTGRDPACTAPRGDGRVAFGALRVRSQRRTKGAGIWPCFLGTSAVPVLQHRGQWRCPSPWLCRGGLQRGRGQCPGRCKESCCVASWPATSPATWCCSEVVGLFI